MFRVGFPGNDPLDRPRPVFQVLENTRVGVEFGPGRISAPQSASRSSGGGLTDQARFGTRIERCQFSLFSGNRIVYSRRRKPQIRHENGSAAGCTRRAPRGENASKKRGQEGVSLMLAPIPSSAISSAAASPTAWEKSNLAGEFFRCLARSPSSGLLRPARVCFLFSFGSCRGLSERSRRWQRQ
jgi:hypothetical protein